MRRKSIASIVVRLSLAFLALIGLQGSAWNTARCATAECGGKCPMHEASQPKQTQSCCPEREPATPVSDESAKASCNCRISPLSDLADHTVAVVTIPILVFVMPALQLDICQSEAVVDSVRAILFHSDSSPPNIGRHPDSGRAPPFA